MRLLLENQGGTGDGGGPGAVSIQTGPVVSGAHRHTVTLCLIGAGQSPPRGIKGHARPVLLAVLSLVVSHNMDFYLQSSFFYLINSV